MKIDEKMKYDQRTTMALELYRWIGGARTRVDCEIISTSLIEALSRAGFKIVPTDLQEIGE